MESKCSIPDSDRILYEDALAEARRGSRDAMNRVGECYQYGRGTRVHFGKAIFWYQEAALSGSWEGQINLQSMIAELGTTQSELMDLQHMFMSEYGR